MKHVALFLALLCGISAGRAAELRYTTFDPNDANSGPAVILSGEIRKGDYQAILRFARKDPIRFNGSVMILASPGGDLLEAIRIGGFIKKTYQNVFVNSHIGKCASACFLIYVAAVDRSAIVPGLGIHRPYFAPSEFEKMPLREAEQKHRRLMDAVRKYLEDQQVPQYLIERMFSLASTEIYWLNYDDISSVGVRANWWDQLLVDRCKLDKQLDQGFLNEGDHFARAAEAREHISRVAACAYTISAEERKRNLKELLGATR